MDDSEVYLTDVTGRDGFQMEKDWIETEDKLLILQGIINAGIKRIEATSFVSSKSIPQLKDAKEVVGNLKNEEITVAALVPNVKGAENALESGVDEINFVLSISETHNRKNVNHTVRESLEEVYSIQKLINSPQTVLNVSLGTTFGCPFEGKYNVSKVCSIMEQLINNGIDKVTLADTTGMANPKKIRHYITTLKEVFPHVQLSLHLHNTRGMGLVNLLAGYKAGVRHFDASLGGIGGCPFAPGATGNVCLEDIVHMFMEMEIPIEHSINLQKLINTSKKLERILGYQLAGQVMKAGTAGEVIKN
ncbi:hydroxymethylglutaryl-CoA lyase [Oceanobacillus kimchii]|uniref:hydroxymethylglutaryl-CoA lyase n=1 Tax=Oceanobacillus kimchii TaxID=746691 RepID=UPI000984335B|nr:hydroxymethylglutaryl-CoA lyase [Oceanobacillus kimchii]